MSLWIKLWITRRDWRRKVKISLDIAFFEAKFGILDQKFNPVGYQEAFYVVYALIT